MASIKFKLKNKEYANGEYPIVLQIIKNRKTKIISLGFFAQPKNWDSKGGLFKSNHSNAIVLNTALEKIKLKAHLILLGFEEDNLNFTLKEFEDKFRTSSNQHLSVFDFWEEIITEMENSNRIGNARVNKETSKSIKKFYGSNELTFGQVNVSFLEKYEVFLRKNGGSNGGVGVRMRALRALYNNAIRRGLIKKSKYPFMDYKISKLKSNPFKRALSIDVIKRIEGLSNLEANRLINARNYFLFSFYTRGMNFADMIHLKWSNISENNIYYTRAKTKVSFVIKILPPIQDILEHYKIYGNQTDYIFPILFREDYTPNQIQNRKKKMLSEYNQDLRHIARLCNIDYAFTSYAARHSFANCLKQKGISTDIISESMGHQTLTVTQSYLKTLGNTTLDDACESLLE
ncbi:MAG: site-specific integrase [Maribacter sp.]|uniref:site-specific integrase n=1 Tax=Maribacter sp. TaxID=1897614 RepID=UPI00329A577A